MPLARSWRCSLATFGVLLTSLGCAMPAGITAPVSPGTPAHAPPEAVGPPVPLLPPAAPRATPPRPFPMTVTPCPLKPAPRGMPGCGLERVEGAATGLVSRVERLTCRFNSVLRFTGLGSHTALRLGLPVTEGATSFAINLLQHPDGTARLVPGGLMNALAWHDGLVGFAGGPHRLAFWKDGVCEEPPDGWLTDLVARNDDELVAVLQRWDRSTEFLLRTRQGAWSSLGAVEAGRDALVHAQGGRLTLEVRTRDAAREVDVRFPELARAEVVTRGRFATSDPPIIAMAPLPPRPDSRFGDAWVTQWAWVDGVLSVSRPLAGRAYERTLVSDQLRRSECREGERWDDTAAPASRRDTRFQHVSSPAVLALSSAQAVVAWVEQRGACQWRHVPEAPTHCLPQQPCAPPAPAYWAATRQVEDTTLVLMGMAPGPRELARVPLPLRDESTSLAGVDLAETDREVVVQAWGHLVHLDRKTLTEALR